MIHAAKERRKCVQSKRKISQCYVIDEYRFMNKFGRNKVSLMVSLRPSIDGIYV